MHKKLLRAREMYIQGLMWASWGCMVVCSIATFAWLHMQPTSCVSRQNSASSIPTPDTICGQMNMDKKQQIVRVCVKLSLAFSMVFAVMYFVILIEQGSDK
jgi:hypothetical protein